MGWLLCYQVTLLLSHILSFCTCQDKLVPGQNITGNQTLVSSIGTFSLGFFNPENSTKYFLGIRINTFPNTAIVWIANRESPLDAPGFFMLGSDGNLVVLDDSRNLVWSTNASISASAMNHTTGLLEDSGNLVLSSEAGNVWQSFDHPSDTMLPGIKLSFNKKTGQRRRLTSWAALGDPQPGMFTVGFDPQVPIQIFTWNDTAPYVRTSVCVGKYTTAYFQNQSGPTIFFSWNTDDDEVYGVYSVSDSSVKFRLWLSPTGQIKQFLWQGSSKTWLEAAAFPSDNCDFYARCGLNSVCHRGALSPPCKCLTGFTAKFPNQSSMGDWSGGCIREKVLACDNGIQGNFSTLKNVKLPDHFVLLKNRNISECESECGRNCSCTAYAYVHETGASTGKCLAWFGELLDLVMSPSIAHDVNIRVYGSESGKMGVSVNSLKRILVIALVSASVGLLTTTFGCFLWKKKLGRIARRVSKNIRKVSAGGGNNDTELPLFSLRSILVATNNFSGDKKLGEGGFGPVYKGILPENQEAVAIKRLSKKSGQGHHEFMNELKLIAKLQHNNLARLLGCCMEEEELILIYEYMPNRSLDKFLFDPCEKTTLDWNTRFRIIQGIAQGVLYIHKHSRLKIIHRDLKASNVLLDGAMNPKVSDFGMARIFDINQIEANTNKVVGTYGYMSPEYVLYGHFSEKLDVFSFGVLLLEIVSGKKNASFYRYEKSLTLAQWVWELWNEGRGVEVIDASVREACWIHEALRCIHVGLLCVQEAPADRPTMSLVIHMLEADEATSLPPSKEPAFSTYRNSIPVTAYSENVVTITLPEPR